MLGFKALTLLAIVAYAGFYQADCLSHLGIVKHIGGKLIKPILAAKLGILGPLKLAILSKTSFGLGLLGTGLGILALAKTHGHSFDHFHGHDSGYDEQEVYYVPQYRYVDSYSYYTPSGQGNYGYRKKRDTTERSVDVELSAAFESVQKSDPSRCTERLVCDLASKSNSIPQTLSPDEAAILSLVKAKPIDKSESQAHSQFELAMRQGLQGDNCGSVYETCPFDGDELMSLVRFFGNSIPKSSYVDVLKYT